MKKKFLGRLLTMLLIVSMTLTLLPVPAMAAYGSSSWGSWKEELRDYWNSFWNKDKEDTTEEVQTTAQTATADNSEFLRIFHLDCGRKYFSVEQIERIIDQLAANNYTHLQLAFGNDALRFLLDEMGVGSYTSSQVRTAITTANNNYASKNGTEARCLSEEDMGKILAYAKEKDIEIIPLLNSPGHMSVLISAMQTLGVSSSSSMSLTDTNQVNFIQGLLGLYINYFKENCTYFNMGADEYSFDKLDSTGYSKFVEYVNAVAKKITDAGLKPIAFNDGIYYKASDTNFAASAAKIDKSIIVAYWTAGGSRASSETLSTNGFMLLNNNSAWYYVLGDALYTEWKDGHQWGYNDSKNALQSTPCTTLQDNGKANVVGSVLCVWCDYPKYSYESSKVFDLIATMAANNPNYFKASSTPVEPEGLTLSPSSATLTVGSSITVTANKDVTKWTSGDDEVATLTSTDKQKATVTAVSEGTATITATTAENESAQVTVNVTKQSAAAKTEEFTFNIGETKTFTQSGDVTGSVGQFTNAGVANVSASHEKSDATTIEYTASAGISGMKEYQTNYVSNLIDGKTNTKFWSDRAQAIGQYVQVKFDNAIPVDALRLTSCDGDACTNADVKVSADGTSWTTLGSYTGSTTPIIFENTAGDIKYIRVELTEGSNQWWQLAEIEWGSYSNGRFSRMPASGTVNVPAKDETEITFKGVAEGTTQIQIGDTLYKITVEKEDLSKADKLPIQLWVTNNTIQLDNTHDGNTTKATTGNFCTGKDQHSTFHSGTHYAQYLTVEAGGVFDGEAVNSDNGVPLSKCVPNEIKQRYEYNGTRWSTEQSNKSPFDLLLCKGTVLSSDNLQLIWGDSQVSKGRDFYYVRYLNGVWEVSSDRISWDSVTGSGSMGSVSGCSEQIVAYYYIRTTLTDEVTTNVVDWGDPYGGSLDSDKVLLDFAVNIGTSGRSPALNEFPINNKTLIYHCDTEQTSCVTTDTNGKAYRRIDDIGVTNTGNYEVYMITLKPTNDNPNTKLSSSPSAIYDNDNGTEKVVWVIDRDALERSAFNEESKWYTGPVPKGETEPTTKFDPNDTTGRYVGGSPVIPRIDIYSGQGMLVTYYLRSKATIKLTVHYIDQKSNTEFCTIEFPVNENTYFNANFGKNADETLHDATVQTDLNKTFTVEPNLSKLPQIDAKYRRIKYTLVDANLGNNTTTAKDAYLYYTFDNTESFVVDFGLPLTIAPTDVGNLSGATITSAKVTSATSDQADATVTGNGTITYKPLKPLGEKPDTFTVAYTGKGVEGATQESATVEFTFYIYPASNVLYEENFLKEETGGSSTISWSNENFADHTTAQQTQKVGQTGKNVFGYDKAYVGTDENPVKGQLGVWSVTDMEAGKGLSKALTTEFYGNGFDLIGDCGPDTGRVLLLLTNKTTNKGKLLDIDTRYNDGVGDYGTTTLNQVPLAHVMFDEEGTYTATIYAGGKAATTTSTQSGANGIAAYSGIATYAAAMPVVSYDDDVYAVLEANGLSMADVEYVNVSAADSTAVPAARRAAAAPTNGIATYAATDTTTEVKHAAGTHVEIDGFRVYRSSTNNTNYPNDERDMTYVNVLDKVTFNNGKCAYTELDASHTLVSREDYETTYGGPQNEIYLTTNQSVVFNTGLTEGTEIQISARAVTNASAKLNNKEIGSNTEMYYKVQVGENGTLAIQNYGGGMLAIANLKVPASTTFQTVTDETLAIAEQMLLAYAAAPVDPEPEQPTVFAPERFDASVSTSRFFRNKYITLTVKASADVARLTVNGKELRPNNSWLVKKGWSDTYTYVLTETVKKNESRTYDIVAYDANGLASETKTLRAD